MTPKRIQDPDFGEIVLPDGPAVPKAEWDAAKRDLAARTQGQRAWKPGKTHECPTCGRKAFEGRDDISLEFVRQGKVYIFAHLHGARCKRCNAQTIEAYEQIALEDEIGVGLRPDYEAKVSKIGSGSLGTYWPRDLERLFGLRPDQRVFMEIVGPGAVLVRFRDPT